MRAIYLILIPFVCSVVERPVAIIPWSQYQQRMKLSRTKDVDRNEIVDSNDVSPYDSHRRYSQSFGTEDQMPPPRPSGDRGLVTPRPRSRPIIRSQIRNRVPAEPSDFLKQKVYNVVVDHKPVKNVPVVRYPPAPQLPVKEETKPIMRKVAASPKTSFPKDIRIPNGVPFHAGDWQEGQPNYIPEPRVHSANSLSGIDPLSLSALNQINAGSQPVVGESGNIVNSIFSRAQSVPIDSIQNIQTSPNLMESFLANQGNLDTLSKLAKNLLSVGDGNGGSGGGGLLDLMTNALKGGRLPFTSTANHDDSATNIQSVVAPQRSLMENFLNQAASAINTSIKEKEKADKLEKSVIELKSFEPPITTSTPPEEIMSKEREDSLKLLERVPQEKREILEAAIKSKEIDLAALLPAINELIKEDTKEESKKEKESRLLEWIRANRPNKQAEVKVSADKLPYYGKYCGSLVEQANLAKSYQCSGAIWAVDDQRLIVSKFFFKPTSLLSENITFWLGPSKATTNALVDQFPSQNGFYVKPEPIDVAVFALNERKSLEAKHRSTVKANVLINGASPIEPLKEKKKEEEVQMRSRRDTIQMDQQIPTYVPAHVPSKKPVELLVKGGVVQVMGESVEEVLTNTTDFNPPTNLLPTNVTAAVEMIQPGIQMKQPEYEPFDPNTPQPLDWYAGFQPLLLTLPSDKKVSQLKWISLRDHKKNEIIASLLLPNGAAFTVPSPVTVRPLSPNGLFNISSGPIQINDMKSIVITNFTLKTEGEAVWFMMGKDILPNTSGHIIPVYDPQQNTLDCDSLKDYYGDEVHLRIPGHLDMRDVFWLSVFNPSKALSYSHLYLPYDHLRLPPDLSGMTTANCVLKP